MNLQHLARYQLPLVAWVVVIFVLSTIPKFPDVRLPISPDKLAHVGIYFVLCMLSRRAFFYQERLAFLHKHALQAAFWFTLVYGALDEFHQLYVPGRWADVYDVIADGIGGALFVGVFAWKSRRKTPERKS